MFEDIKLSFKGIWSHKMRSFLTMLGIIVGIASVIAVVSTIKGTNDQIKSNLIGDGSNTVTVELYKDGWPVDLSYESIPSGIPVFTDDVKAELIKNDAIEDAAFYRFRDWADSLYFRNIQLQNQICGIDDSYLYVSGLQITKGRGFSEYDHKNYNKVALIDKIVLNSLEGDDPLGKVIDINGEPFTVIGIVDKRSECEPVINSVQDYLNYVSSSSGTIYIPQELWPVCFKFDEPLNVIVKATSTDDMISAGNAAISLLNSKLSVADGSDIKYASGNLANAAASLNSLSSSTNILMIGIASISLLVGGIGVMNIMLVSVTERTREIGLKKALGAKKRRIRSQFLTEAVILSGIGGILGVITGIILSYVISAVALIPVSISTPAVVIAVLFSMVIGIVFGMLPSVKASNLNPIDALRYE